MSLTTEVGMDVMLNLSNAPQAVNDIEKAIGAGVDKGLTGSLKTNQKNITSTYAKAMVGAIRLSNKEAAANLEREFKERSKKIEHESREIQRREALLQRAQTDFIKKKLRERIEGSRARIREEQKALKEMGEKQIEYQREAIEMLDRGMEKAAKNFGDRLEDSVSNFQDLLSSAMGDPAEFIKKMGSGMKESSSGVFTMGAKMSAGGGKMAGVGKLLMGLGKVMPLLAGVTTAVAGLVAVFMMAYGQTKEFNKSILEGASAVDLLGDSAGSARDLTDALATTRQSAQVLAFQFRTSTEELLGFAKAMNDANFTFAEQTKLFDHQARAMHQALLATQAFGVGGGEVATMINTMAEDFAYGQDQIREGFQDIFGAAQMSGLGIKNFFTAISEATSGMALYNFRLEDTLELIIGLEKVLGEEMGKDVLMGARDKFKESGYQDRLGFRMKMGSRAFGMVESSEQKKATTEFNRVFQNLPEELRKSLAAESGGAIGAGGVLGVAGAKELGKMSAAQIGELQNMLREQGKDEMAIQLGNLRRVGMGGGALMGEMGVESALAADMMGAVGYLGDTLIGDMSEYQKMAFEQNQGISGSMLKAYEEIQNRVAGELGEGATATDVAKAIMEGDLLTDEDKEKLAELQKEAGQTMEDVAKQQLKETQSILDTLKNGVVLVLETIYDMLANSIIARGPAVDIRGARQARESAQKALMEFEETGDEKADAEARGLLEKEVRVMATAYQKALGGSLNAEGEARVEEALGGMSTTSLFERLKSQGPEGYIPGMGNQLHVGGQVIEGGGVGLGMLRSTEQLAAQMAIMDPENQTKLLEAIKTETEAAQIEGEKESEDQVKATDKTTRAVDKLHEAFLAEGRMDLAKMLGDDFQGEISTENKAEIQRILSKDGITPLERQTAIAAGIELDDFIYRGDARSGTIHPIDSRDSFFGAKPGGAIDRALSGRSVVISNLTINESGNPKKTLQMVKQAITAASWW